MELIARNIRFLRLKKNMSQDDLAEQLGYKSFTTIQKWESGISTPPLGVFIKMAEIFAVDLDDFARTDLSSPLYDPRMKLERPITVPVYDRIPAGISIEAVEDISGYIEINGQFASSGQDYFAMTVRDNSMNPKYEDGDIVLFEHQSIGGNGNDCAVRIGENDATLKKVRITDQGMILQSLNPEYEPIHIASSDNNISIEILGIAREIRRKV